MIRDVHLELGEMVIGRTAIGAVRDADMHVRDVVAVLGPERRITRALSVTGIALDDTAEADAKIVFKFTRARSSAVLKIKLGGHGLPNGDGAEEGGLLGHKVGGDRQMSTPLPPSTSSYWLSADGMAFVRDDNNIW